MRLFPKDMKKIPYGIADFSTLLNDNYYYVDKTEHIPVLEDIGRFLFLIRPRRFGKSLWASVLEQYYDINQKDEFDTTFDGLWIKDNPTELKNSFLVLRFDFAAVNPDIRYVEESFNDHIEVRIHSFIGRYRHLFKDKVELEVIDKTNNVVKKLDLLSELTQKENLSIYLIIDEYDNFTNTILTTVGEDKYHKITHGEGFYRHFFNVFKSAVGSSAYGLSRIYVTGVSPVTMDDVTSGFNIGTMISLHPGINGMVGFSQTEVLEMLQYYQKRYNRFDQSIEETFELMSKWYDNYRFAEDSDTTMFYSDMVLYFINYLILYGKYPKEMIDHNVRIDYGKLRHLVQLDNQLNGNFSKLKDIIETGKVTFNVQTGFPVSRLLDSDNFLSLLYYFGLISYDKEKYGKQYFTIPNITIEKLMFSYMRDAYRDTGIFKIDTMEFGNLLADMAYQGEFKPVFADLSAKIEEQTSVRDYIEGEKVIQTFFLAYFNITYHFLTSSEHEANKGYTDILLMPFFAKWPDMPYGYIIEFKYFSRGEYTKQKQEQAIKDAQTQLEKYRDDPKIQTQIGDATLKTVVVVFNGWEMLYCDEVG